MEDMNKLDSKTTSLITILNAQNEILDCILGEQNKIHESVVNKKWDVLENCLFHMDAFCDAFVELDQNREKIVGEDRGIYFIPEIEPLFKDVRTKLTQSKIENNALSTYVNTTQKFLEGFFNQCVPQDRNVLYTNKGYIKKPMMQSVVVNRLL